MRRRDFLTLASSVAVIWPLAASADLRGKALSISETGYVQNVTTEFTGLAG